MRRLIILAVLVGGLSAACDLESCSDSTIGRMQLASRAKENTRRSEANERAIEALERRVDALERRAEER